MRRGSFLVFALVVLLGGSSTGASSSLTRSAASACVAQWQAVAKGRNVPLLHDVAPLSRVNTWSVGEVEEGGRTVPVVAHWNGRRLSVERVLAPSSPGGGALVAISAAAPDDVWAVGARAKKYPASQREPVSPLVVRWDGRRWRTVPMPSTLANVALGAVKAFSRSDVWAVGSVGVWPTQHAAVVHWDGRGWRLWRLDGPASALWGIDGVSTRNLWAVGGARMNASQMAGQSRLVVRWDGERWQPSTALDAKLDKTGELYLIGIGDIDVRTATDLWAVGSDFAGAVDHVIHSNGRSAHETFRTEVGGLYAVAAVSTREAWAVGGRYEPDRPLVAHGDGTKWQVYKTALDGLHEADLQGISAVSPHEVWAVGRHLVARYSCD